MDPLSKICSKINGTRNALLEWSKILFGHLKVEIETIRAQLAHFFDTSFSAIPTEDRLFLESKLNDLLHQENAFWKQRAKFFWLTDGDLNTNFFHKQVSNRRRKKMIKGLYDEDGLWCTDEDDLENIVLQ